MNKQAFRNVRPLCVVKDRKHTQLQQADLMNSVLSMSPIPAIIETAPLCQQSYHKQCLAMRT